MSHHRRHHRTRIGAAVAGIALAGGLAGAADLALAQSQQSEDLFSQAVERRDERDLLEAMRLFEQILASEPQLGRARLELALTQFRALRFEEARGEAERVLADPGTPDSVKATIRAFLENVEREGRTHVWTPSAAVGYFHDDNVNVGPVSDVLDIQGLLITVVPVSRPKGDNAFNFQAGLEHRYLSPNRMDIAGTKAALAWTSKISAFRDDYTDLSDFDLDVFTARTGPALLMPGVGRAALALQWEEIRLGNDSLASFRTVEPAFTWEWGKVDVNLTGRAQQRDFKSTANDGRDGWYYSLTAGVRRPFADNRVMIEAGLRAFTLNADAGRFSNEGWEAFAGVNWLTWRGGLIQASVSRKSSDHDGPEPLFGISRDERLVRMALAVNHRFQGSALLSGTVLTGYISNNNNRSNVSLFEYERTQFGLRVSREF